MNFKITNVLKMFVKLCFIFYGKKRIKKTPYSLSLTNQACGKNTNCGNILDYFGQRTVQTVTENIFARNFKIIYNKLRPLERKYIII